MPSFSARLITVPRETVFDRRATVSSVDALSTTIASHAEGRQSRVLTEPPKCLDESLATIAGDEDVGKPHQIALRAVSWTPDEAQP